MTLRIYQAVSSSIRQYQYSFPSGCLIANLQVVDLVSPCAWSRWRYGLFLFCMTLCLWGQVKLSGVFFGQKVKKTVSSIRGTREALFTGSYTHPLKEVVNLFLWEAIKEALELGTLLNYRLWWCNANQANSYIFLSTFFFFLNSDIDIIILKNQCKIKCFFWKINKSINQSINQSNK